MSGFDRKIEIFALSPGEQTGESGIPPDLSHHAGMAGNRNFPLNCIAPLLLVESQLTPILGR